MKSYIKFFSILSLAGLFAACSQVAAEKSKKDTTQSNKTEHQVAAVKSDTLQYELTLPGELKPYDEVTLYAKIEGFVKDLKVDRGDEVKKGELLMKIEAPEVQQKFLAAKAKEREILEKLSFSQQNYQRMNEASSVDGAISAIELEQSKAKFMADSAALSAVRAEVAAARQLAEYREIRAPFDGVVTNRHISPGALVGSGKEPLVELSREDKLRLEVAIPSKHTKALQIDSEASFTVNSFPGREFPVKFSRSSKTLNRELRAMMVEFDYDNPKYLLEAGAYAQVNLSLKRKTPTLSIPSSSIIRTPSNIFVAKVVSGKVQLVPVTTGMTKAKRVEVFGDIKEGDQIIVKGNSTFKDGMEIAVTEDKNG